MHSLKSNGDFLAQEFAKILGVKQDGIEKSASLEGAPVDATVEAARIAQNAQTQIEAERQSAVVTLRKEVGSLAIDLASGVVGEQLSDDAKASAMVDRFLADLEASEKAAK